MTLATIRPAVPTAKALNRAAAHERYHAQLDAVELTHPFDTLLVGGQSDRGPVWRRPYPGVGGPGRVVARFDPDDRVLIKPWVPESSPPEGIPWPVDLFGLVDAVHRPAALRCHIDRGDHRHADRLDLPWPVARRYAAAAQLGHLAPVTIDVPCLVIEWDAWAGLAVGPIPPGAATARDHPELGLGPIENVARHTINPEERTR